MRERSPKEFEEIVLLMNKVARKKIEAVFERARRNHD